MVDRAPSLAGIEQTCYTPHVGQHDTRASRTRVGAGGQGERGRQGPLLLCLANVDHLDPEKSRRNVPVAATCPACNGFGSRRSPRGSIVPCPDCQGQGLMNSTAAASLLLEPCPACKGDGRFASYAPDEACPCCLGIGDVPAILEDVVADEERAA